MTHRSVLINHYAGEGEFASNYISTTHYTLWNFLPLSLFNQFRRLANFYFLCIAVMQSLPVLSVLNPITSILPLVFVVGVSMLRDAFEDYKRYKSDTETNNQPVLLLKDGLFQLTKSCDIKVGDICLIKDDETFPADFILLASAHSDGAAFIQTSSLDGEKNLKKRVIPKNLQNKFVQGNNNPSAYIQLAVCDSEPATDDLYTYVGKLTVNGQVFPLDINQFLLKGSNLQNTEWVVGFCIFTGKDTRLMMNAQASRVKLSALEQKLNNLVIVIVVTVVLVCLTLAIMSETWNLNAQMQTQHYIKPYGYSKATSGVITFFRYFLLLNTMLPISLFVSLEVIKVCQSIWLAWDTNIYCIDTDKPAKVSNSSIIEDLGQVHYLFSDKTGTLTKNLMSMRAVAIGDCTFDSDENGFKIGEFQDKYLSGNLVDQFEIASKSGKSKVICKTYKELINEFMKVLSLAHECVREKVKDDFVYRGPSPDEVQLVEFAKDLNFKFLGQSNKHFNVCVEGIEYTYEVLKLIEFNSDRKRMSLLVKDPIDGLIKMYIKGADSIIEERLADNNDKHFLKHVNKFVHDSSVQGLRTLLIAMKVIDLEDYADFLKEIEIADSVLENRDQNMAQVFDRFERGLTLLGATAVEDQLQNNVAETIYDLQRAGIKIWMLTGDKFETAENIGMSCRLIGADFHLYKMQEVEDVESILSETTMELNSKLMSLGKKRAIIIAAQALTIILADFQKQTKFVKLAKTCDSVICCRVSPGQKADVVRLIKRDDSETITAAIGDGANDVSMIREAHIGIGLYGNEGMRAVQSSDFALGEFQYLWQLFLVHGRLSYLNNAEMIPYFFYKNMVMTLPSAFFAFYAAFSGQTLYEDFYITFYNMGFTAFPLLFRAMCDFDVCYQRDKTMRKHIPCLFYEGQMSLACNAKVFSEFIFLGFAHAVIVFFIPIYSMATSGVADVWGSTDDIWLLSITSFTAVIFVVCFKLAVMVRSFNWMTAVAFMVPSFAFYIVYQWANNWINPKLHTVVYHDHQMPYFYLNILLCVGLCLTLDYAKQCIQVLVMPSPSQYLRKSLKDGSLDEDAFGKIVDWWKVKQLEAYQAKEQSLDQRRSEIMKYLCMRVQ